MGTVLGPRIEGFSAPWKRQVTIYPLRAYEQDMSASTRIQFTCPECEESLAIDGSKQTALVENGCVVCGARLSESEFDVTS
jgi:hypothetical protein